MHSIFKKVFLGLLALLTISYFGFQNISVAQSNNYINPDSYLHNHWGDLSASFEILSESQTAFARITIDQYSDGDAKWFLPTNQVIGASTYSYSDSYRSSAETYYWAQFFDQAGTVSYQFLDYVPASNDWQTHYLNFNTPENTALVNIFHTIASLGYLDVKELNLYPANNTCPETSINQVFNGSFEETCLPNATFPGWEQLSGQAQYSITSNLAYSGANSFLLDSSNSGNGEFGLVSHPIQVDGSQNINLSFYHASNAYLYAYIETITETGELDYLPLTSVPASNGQWDKYSDTFALTANIKYIRVFIATDDHGYVYIDDINLEHKNATGSFNQALISIHFDDGLVGSYQNGEPILNNFDMLATYYLNASTLNTKNYLSTAQVIALANKGNEIGSHGYYHTNVTNLSQHKLSTQTILNKNTLSQMSGQSINSFSFPFGAYNNKVVSNLSNYHTNLRDTSGALNYKHNFDPLNLHAKVITNTTSLGELQNLIQLAQNNNAWLILVFHDINPETPENEYTISAESFTEFVQLIDDSNIQVTTTQTALNTLSPQL